MAYLQTHWLTLGFFVNYRVNCDIIRIQVNLISLEINKTRFPCRRRAVELFKDINIPVGAQLSNNKIDAKMLSKKIAL